MNRTETSNVVDISTLSWIKPSLFINHAKLDGDYTTIELTDTIIADRSGYTDDENLFVQYLQSAISVVENYLPFDLQAKTYEVFKDPCLKFSLRGRIDESGFIVSYNNVLVPAEDIKIVDNVVYITELDDSGDSTGGSYIRANYDVLTIDVNEHPDILQAILFVFTYLFDNRGDCVGNLCGCNPAKQALFKYKTVLV